MDLDKFNKRLNSLMKEGTTMMNNCSSIENMDMHGESNEMNIAHAKWRLSCLNLMRYFFGEKHYFYQNFLKSKCTWTRKIPNGDTHHFSYCKESIADEIAVLHYIKDEINWGLVSDAKHMYQSELFSNLLEQAFELCDNGYIIASAVFGRLVIENFINDLLRLKEIEIGEKENMPNKLVKLRNEGIIDLPTERIIQSHYDIGTYAVHGKKEFERYNKEKIKDFLEIIQNKILTI